MITRMINGLKMLALVGTIGGVVLPISSISASAATPATSETVLENRAESFLEAVYEFLELQEDGTIAFMKSMPKNYYTEYDLSGLQQWFNYLNGMVNEGIISFNEDFSINQVIIKAGLTYSENHWWGVRHYKSHDSAKSWVSQLRGISNATDLLQILGLHGAVLDTAVTIYINWLTNVIEDVNNFNSKLGVMIDINWPLIYDVRSQG